MPSSMPLRPWFHVLRAALISGMLAVLVACGSGDGAPNMLVAPDHHWSEGFLTEVAAGDDGNVSEAYLLERIHAEWARNLGVVMGNLWYRAPADAGVKSVSTRTWPDDHRVVVEYVCGASLYVSFKALAYDPELSAIVYGKTVINETVPTELGGHAYLYDLSNSSEPGAFNQTDTITLEQSRSVTLTHSTDFNVTASSETTVGGTFSGVGVEEKITVATGLAFHDEQQTAAAESTARTESHSFDVSLPPFEATLITLSSTQVQSSTPFSMNAIATFSVDLSIRDHCPLNYPSAEFDTWLSRGACWITDHGCSGNHDANLDWCPPKASDSSPGYTRISSDGCSFSFEFPARVSQWLHGTHERWPGMGRWGPWVYGGRCSGACWESYQALFDIERRRIQLAGTQHRVYEDAVKEVVTNVSGQDLDKVLSDHSALSCDATAATCGDGAAVGMVDPLRLPRGGGQRLADPTPQPDPVLDRVIDRTAYLWAGLQAATAETLDFADAAHIIAAVIAKGE